MASVNFRHKGSPYPTDNSTAGRLSIKLRLRLMQGNSPSPAMIDPIYHTPLLTFMYTLVAPGPG